MHSVRVDMLHCVKNSTLFGTCSCNGIKAIMNSSNLGGLVLSH